MNFNWQVKYIIYFLFSIALIITAVFSFKVILPCLIPFLLGFIAAYLTKPASNLISKRLKIKKSVSAVIALIFFYAIICSMLWFLGLFAVTEIGKLSQNLPDVYYKYILPSVNEINLFFVSLLSKLNPEIALALDKIISSLLSNVTDIVTMVSAKVLQWLSLIGKGFPIFALTFIFTMVSSILISKDYDNITGFLKRQIPSKQIPIYNGIKHFLKNTVVKFLKAYLIIFTVTFFELFLGFMLLRIKNSFLIALIIAVCDIMPIIGSGLFLVPWCIWLIIKGQVFGGVGIGLIYLIISVVRSVIEPKIIGHQIGLHPLVTLISMFCGIKLMGFSGIIIAPILVLLIKYLNENKIIKLYNAKEPYSKS